MDATVDRIKISLEGESTSATKAISRTLSGLRGLSKGASEVAHSLKGLDKPIDAFTSKFTDALTRIKNIMVYRLLRGGISKMIQGLEEGKKNIVAYDEALSRTSFSQAATLMQHANENATLLKNTFGSLYMTIYAYLEPAINGIANALVNAANAANIFISSLMGRDGYTKAVKGVGSVTKAVGDLKKQIFGFDELNILKAPGGAESDSSFTQFEETPIPLAGDTIQKAITDSIKNGDWNNVGKLIAFKLNDAIANIDLASIGEALGSKINAGIKTLSSFLDNFSFTQVGQKIAEFINNALGEISADEIGNIVSKKFTSLADAIIGFVETLNWKQVGEKIHDFFVGAVNGVVDWALKIDWPKLGKDVVDAFFDLVAGLKFDEVASKFFELAGLAWGAAFNLLSGAVQRLAEKILPIFKDGLLVGLVDIAKWIDEHIVTPIIKGFFAAFGIDIGTSHIFTDMGEALINSIKDGLASAWQGVQNFYDTYIKPFVDTIKNVGSTISNGFSTILNGGKTPKKFANGGMPTSGDLFIADEKTPELIGSFGNRTGVYNQEQFAGAMAAANQQVVNAVLAIGSQITGAVNNKPVPSVRIGDRDIFNASQRGSTLVGNSLIQGGRP